MSHKAEPGHELSQIVQRSGYVNLAHEEDVRHVDQSFSQSYPKVRDFLRRFRLQLVTLAIGSFTNWRTDIEHRKVAMHSSRSVATVQSLLHLVPLGGAMVLLVFQCSSYLVGYKTMDSSILQFLAKIHELTMQASIVDVILCLIRIQIVDGFVPLGMLSGAVRASQISYLWSLDYLSIFKSSSPQGWRKPALALTLAVLIFLISLVGPSSAILMIPRPGSSQTRKPVVMYALNLTEDLHPSYLNSSNGFDVNIASVNLTINAAFDQASEGWQKHYDGFYLVQRVSYLSQDSYIPITPSLQDEESNDRPIYDRVLQFSYTNSMRTYKEGFEGSNDYGDWQVAKEVNATIPTSYSAASFKNIDNETSTTLDGKGTYFTRGYTKNGTATVKMAYPLVNAQCVMSYGGSDAPPEALYFKDGSESVSSISTFSALAQNVSGSAELFGTQQYYAPVWIPSPQPGSSALVGVFISQYASSSDNRSSSILWPTDNSNQTSDNDRVTIWTCTLAAFWDVGEIQLHQNLQPDMGRHENLVKTKSFARLQSNEPRPIKLDVSHIDAIHSAQFHRHLLNTIPDWTSGRANEFDSDRYPFALAAAFALAISRTPRVTFIDTTNTPMLQDLKAIRPPEFDPANSTTYKFIMTDYGYGYGTRSTSVYLSMAVIFTYCIITIAYIIYTIWTGTSSTAWSSGIELVTLALQSKKPDIIGHASVGIDSINTFSQSVGIRVNADDQLELVFAHDRDIGSKGLQKLKRNVEY